MSDSLRESDRASASTSNSATSEPATTLCPSFRCAEGASLLGIVRRDGTVGFLDRPLEVTPEFVQLTISQPVPPEARFRFAGPCQCNGCGNWSRGRCDVVELALVQHRERSPAPNDLSAVDCRIRSQCRWYLQRGLEACRVCPEITTEPR